MRVLRSALLAACLADPLGASALEMAPVPSDLALVSLLGGPGEPAVGFVAQGRIGIPGPGDYELSLGADTSTPPFPTAQYQWSNGSAVKFSLEYSDGVATFMLGGQSLAFNALPDEGFTDLFIRARSADASSVSLSNMELDGLMLEDVSAAKGEIDIVRIASPKLLADGFLLTGLATMGWDGTAPTRSALAFQIKVAEIASVPEPSTALLLLAVGGALYGTRRQRSAA